jgi:hypothetical protein
MPRGGKRKGAGRKAKPRAERLEHDVRIRLTAEQARAVEALEAEGHTARDVLLAGVEALAER